MQKVSNFIKSPLILCDSLVRHLGQRLPDDVYLKLRFLFKMKKRLNLKNPKTYNEKIQWLKIFNHCPEYKKMVDKYEVKKYVSDKIGEKYVIPTYGIWNQLWQIDWDSLPNKFVIKTTHGGGGNGVVVCRDKNVFDVERAVNVLKSSLKQDIYKSLREWPYKDMQKRILAEQLLIEEGQQNPHDYKVLCFGGVVKLIEYHEGRFTDNHTQDFYDRDWNLTTITQSGYGKFNTIPSPKPDLLDEMIRLSEILSEGIPHVRVDWYIVNNYLYFGEMTFFDGSGFEPWDNIEDDIMLGDWISLPSKHK